MYVCVCPYSGIINHEFSPIENPRTVMGIPLRLAFYFYGVMGLFLFLFLFMILDIWITLSSRGK